MSIRSSETSYQAYRFSVAPMLDCTDKHYRVLMRQISKKALLYTEMVVANALHYSNKRNRLLDFNDIEHPISLQLAGDNPKLLAESARMAEAWGYDEINFNVGCPSAKVKSGNFGACLMANPDKVAQCIEAMANATKLTVTIKHRLGIDNLDNNIFLTNFVDRIAAAGAKRFAIHARKAWLEGLDPKKNRTIPPLEYNRVEKLKNNRPNLIIELNGGLNTPQECLKALEVFDGTMVGRSAYSHPLRWQNIDEIIFGERKQTIKPSEVIENLIPYTEKHLLKNGRIWEISRHMLQLVEEVPGAKAWRTSFSLNAQKKDSDIRILIDAVLALKEAGL